MALRSQEPETKEPSNVSPASSVAVKWQFRNQRAVFHLKHLVFSLSGVWGKQLSVVLELREKKDE